jgi:hypothetical protein
MNKPVKEFASLLRWLNFAFMVAVFLSGQARAADQAKKSIEIPAGEALAALKQFVTQSGAQLLYSATEVEGVRTNAAKGLFAPREALERLLQGTSLVADQDERTGALTVRLGARAVPAPMERSGSSVGVFGGLSGQISSAATRNTLEGVVIELPGLRRQVLTDSNGRFEFSSVPAGPVDVSAFDKTIRPQNDLYEYVNGTWLKDTPIPADKSNYGALERKSVGRERV